MIYPYRLETLAQLAHHGVIPKPTTPPITAREVVNSIYRYELRLLRDRYLAGEFSKKDYYDKAEEIRNRYPVMGSPNTGIDHRRGSVLRSHEHVSLSASLAASDIRSFVHVGSHTTSTFTELRPAISRTRRSTSSGIVCAAGHPGAGQRHADIHVRRGVHVDVVDQPQLVDVDRNFRIEHLRELLGDERPELQSC